MKNSPIYFGVSITFIFILSSFTSDVILAQESNTLQGKQQPKETFHPSHFSLNLPLFDTVRPILGNIGKGLKYYDYVILDNSQYKTSNMKKETPVVIKSSFSEIELNILKENLLFIDKQYQNQIKEMIRSEKLDWNLGEAIKGFYMKPIF